MRRSLIALSVILLAACSRAGAPGEPTEPPPTATTGATDAPSPAMGTPDDAPPVPDARAAPVEELLRPGTAAAKVLYGDLDGAPPEEIVVLSAATAGGPGPAQNYLDVFAFRGEEWRSIFDATRFAPAPGEPPILALAQGPEDVHEVVSFLELVDFAGDGVPEVVLAVQTFGASTGPLVVWVLSGEGAALDPVFREDTTSGGLLFVEGSTVRLETGEYRPDDPHCCPSQVKTEVIGVKDGEIGVVSVTLRLATPS